MRLKNVSEFKYMGYVLDELGTDEAQCRRRKAVVAIRSLVNPGGLELMCSRVLYEVLLVPLLMYEVRQ